MKHSKRVSMGLGALVATSALLLAGCSADGGDTDTADGGENLTPIKLQLQWTTQAQFAGYYAAIEQGYFEEEGLDVEVLTSGGDIVPQDALAAGDVDYAIAWVPKVLGSIENGANITNVAQIFERSATLQVAFADSGIETVDDLAGKTIGSWGFGNEWELYAGLNQAGITDDVEVVTQAFDMTALLAGDIDAAQAMTYNEYAQLLEAVNPDTGELYTPEDFTVIDWNEVGTSMLQDAIWADAERLESDEEYAATTVSFLKAAIKGWVYARDNPEEAAALVTEAGSTLGESHQLWMTNEVNKLIWPSGSKIGMIDETAWDSTVAMALETSNETGATIITEEPPASAYSNEYIEEALTELEEEGVDVTGADFTPIEVTLNEGGN
ncbi:MAG TPA: ABC transporter substrate-binding protein [Glaciihabitans sp.]|nr:ABC transporter substrate-binding protein [Glaciihabitans sp.]